MVNDKRRVNVRGIIVRDGKLLAARQKESDGSTSNYWCVPGGGLDPYESVARGLTREMIEETGIAPHIGNLLYIQQFASRRSRHDEELELFFAITNPEDYDEIDLSQTTHGDAEIAEIGFVDPRTVRILPEFLAEVDIVADVTTPGPTQIFDRFDE